MGFSYVCMAEYLMDLSGIQTYNSIRDGSKNSMISQRSSEGTSNLPWALKFFSALLANIIRLMRSRYGTGEGSRSCAV